MIDDKMLETTAGRQSISWRLICAEMRDEGIDVDGHAAYRRKLLVERGYDPEKIARGAGRVAAIDALIYEPAKLATLLRSEGTRFGWNVSASPIDDSPWQIFADEDALISIVWPRHARRYTLAEGRAILLKWLNISDGDKAERVLFEM